MDDARMRRNRRTVHLVFGDATALLAALALLNQSYALLTEAARSAGGPGAVDSLILETSRVIGVEGMIGGQVVDLESSSGSADANTLAGRNLKTVALMRLMMTAGAIAVGRPAEDIRALSEFGESFGRAYQICDDLLDETSDTTATGKSPGQDRRHRRASSVALFGVAGARNFAEQTIALGMFRLSERFGARPEVLMLGEAGGRVLKRAGVELAPAYVA
jgi:geranylgeranyl pyrophosphate synthase